jgi:single-strand DNA-binding protein
MPSINRMILMGHLGQTPEIKYTKTGKAVASLSVATTKKTKETESTEWHKVIAWEHLSDQATQMVKGDLVYVEGELKTRSWEQDGVKKYTTEIVARILVKCDWHKDGKPAQQSKAPASPAEDDTDQFPF